MLQVVVDYASFMLFHTFIAMCLLMAIERILGRKGLFTFLACELILKQLKNTGLENQNLKLLI